MKITPIISAAPLYPSLPWSGEYVFSENTYKYLLNVRVKNPKIPASDLAEQVKLDFCCSASGVIPELLTAWFGTTFMLDSGADILNSWSCNAQHPGGASLYLKVIPGAVRAGCSLDVDVIEFDLSSGGAPGALGPVYSFSSTASLSAFDVSDTNLYPLGTIMMVFNATSWLVETYVLTAGAPTGTQLPANGQPSNHWQKS
jgi:hypothetical protein